MAIIKCKMCGGDLEIASGVTVAECEYCGTKQTLPKANDEVVQNLFNRANNLRIKCEFDKAEQIYEKILQENDTEAEAHWGIVLCKYGIEYVEDPKTFKRIPTCHRTSYDAVTTDADYLAAIEHADAVQKGIYEAEAKAIDAIQKDILNIVKNEKPFDIFICYKETDENGKRTQDSVIANDIYYQLTQEGLKVFYAAITLEDKLGREYEPYIFAALNSAKVMLVIGTKPQYFSAVWVKNEWSRFLKLMKADRSKLLIPCYKDMDAYDLPEEFSHLQAQDMSKIGFINDVVRGIKKVTIKDEPKTTAVKETAVAGNANTAPLLKRAFMFLEDGDWNSANEYCEKVLDLDPECAEAYVGKLMAELQVKKQDALKDRAEVFDSSNNYQKAIRFANEELKATLTGYIAHIFERNENLRLEKAYAQALAKMNTASNKETYLQAAELFDEISEYKDSKQQAEKARAKVDDLEKDSIYYQAVRLMQENNIPSIEKAIRKFEFIPGWKDADELKAQCPELLETVRKNEIYNRAKSLMQSSDHTKIRQAIPLFESISGWKDADALAQQCVERIEKLKEEQAERERKAEAERLEKERQAELARLKAEKLARKKKTIAIIAASVICILIAYYFVLITAIIPISKYNKAIALMDAGKYIEAISAFEALEGYKDSANKITECNIAILDGKYNDAIALMDAGNPDEAYSIFIELGDYKDATDKAGAIRLQKAKEQLKNIKVGSYIKFGTYEQDNNISNGKEDIEWLVLEVKDGKALVISKYALDCQQYNTSYTDVTWETCTLRKWLNNNFLGSAFTADEKTMIPTVTVSADKNPDYSTNPGNATQDQVFLLSITEANKYFSSDSARQCKPTEYAVAGGAYVNSSNGNCWWWLRSPGYYQYGAAGVSIDGGVDEGGDRVDYGDNAVRPALWIDLNS